MKIDENSWFNGSSYLVVSSLSPQKNKKIPSKDAKKSSQGQMFPSIAEQRLTRKKPSELTWGDLLAEQKHNQPTPPKFEMEPKREGLGDVFPFQTGDFWGSMFVFRGVRNVWKLFLSYPVILRILGFWIVPHLVGKYIIPVSKAVISELHPWLRSTNNCVQQKLCTWRASVWLQRE